jgi:hypothetical protein
MEMFLSFKDNISMVKDELNAEEKFFENAVKTERFFNQYKKQLIALAITVAVVVSGNVAYDYIKASKAQSANAAFLILQSHSDDKQALADLKDNDPKLYDLYMLSNAIKKGDVKALEELTSSKALAVSDLAAYQLASLQNNLNGLNTYANGEGAIEKDMALIQSAVLLMEQNKIEEADRKLASVSSESPAYSVAKSLMHYGVK